MRLLLALLFTGHLLQAQTYDAALAQKLGADDYGMKSYVLVILKTGSNPGSDAEAKNKAFAGHMENIGRMAKDGKLVVAGPMGKNAQNYRGIFILDVKTTLEAQELVQTDPAVQQQYLEAEYYPWYGSAALPEYLPAHERITRKNP